MQRNAYACERDNAEGARPETRRPPHPLDQPDTRRGEQEIERLLQRGNRPREHAGQEQQERQPDRRGQSAEALARDAELRGTHRQVQRAAEQMQTVRRGADHRLQKRQDVEVHRVAVIVEGVYQIGAMNRDAERDVSQPDRSANEIFLVAEEAAERHLPMIGRREQAGDGDDAQSDAEEKQTQNPAALVPFQTANAPPDEHNGCDGEPHGQRRESVGGADGDPGGNCCKREPARNGSSRHASTAPNTRSYAAATAGSAKRRALSRAADDSRARNGSSTRTRSSAAATASG